MGQIRHGSARTTVSDLPAGPKDAHSTVLSIEDEAIIVAPSAYIAAALKPGA